MQQTRPTAVTVMGILNIIFGSLGLLCSCGGALVLLFFANPPAELRKDPNFKVLIEQMDFLAQQVPGYKVVSISQMVAGLLLSILLLVTGIGLLNMKKWARTWCFFYSVCTIILQVAGLMYALMVVNPVQARFKPAGMPANSDSQMLSNLLSVVGAMIVVAYAVVLLIVLLLPGVAAAFAPRPADVSPEGERREDYYDAGYERPPEEL